MKSSFQKVLLKPLLALTAALLVACSATPPRGTESETITLVALAEQVHSEKLPNPSGDAVGTYLLAESDQTERWQRERMSALDSIRRELLRFRNAPVALTGASPNPLGEWRYDEGPNGPFVTYQSARRTFVLLEDPTTQSVEAIRISTTGNRLAALVQQGNGLTKLLVVDGPTGKRWVTEAQPGYDTVWGALDSRLFLTEMIAGEPRRLFQVDLSTETPVLTTLHTESPQGGVSLLLHRGTPRSSILATRSSPIGTGLLAIDEQHDAVQVRSIFDFTPGRWLQVRNDGESSRITVQDAKGDILYRLSPTLQLEKLFVQARGHGSLEDHWELNSATVLFIRRRSGISLLRLSSTGTTEVLCDSLSHLTFPTPSPPKLSYVGFRTGIFEHGPTFTIDADTRSCPVGISAHDQREQLMFVRARDGTDIPVLSIGSTHQSQPTFVSLYGSYGVVPWPERNPFHQALLARGFRIVVPFVRGTGFWGALWHAAGSGSRKEISFTDAIDVLQTVISPRAPLIIRGRSAGAALAVITASQLAMAPRAILLEYPLLDIELATTGAAAPLQRREILEWGNFSPDWSRISPAHHDPLAPDTMISVRFGIDDPLIPFGSVVRWIARQRAAHHPNQLLLTWVDSAYGHGERSDEEAAWAESLLFIDTAVSTP